MKKLLAAMTALLLIVALAGCSKPAETPPVTKTSEQLTTAPTSPAAEESAQIISNIRWLVNDPFDVADQWDCQYDAMSNTLIMTGELYDTREIVFFEGAGQIQKETWLDTEGTICYQKEYSEQGNLIYELDEYGYRTVYEYEEGILTRETVYYEDAEPVTVKTWSYDDAGRKLSYTERDEDQVILQESWSYDENGFCTAHLQDSSYGDQSWFDHETFVYKDGLRVESTHKGDDPSNAWDYSMTYRYDDQGRMISALRRDEFYGEAEDLWEFDSEGRVIRSVEHYNMDGWVAVINEQKYNDDGQLVYKLSQEVYLSTDESFYCDETIYTYDSEGRLTQSKCTSMEETEYIDRYDYDALGNQTLYSLVIDGEEQYNMSCDYDSNGTRIRVKRNGETELAGDGIVFLTNENDVEFFLLAEYSDAPAANAAEIAAVNDFLMQYILENA